MLLLLLALLQSVDVHQPPQGDTRVNGTTTITTPTCTLTAAGYTRDEGTDGHLRHRFVVYGTGCGIAGGTTEGKTRVSYASSGELQADQAGAFLITATPGDLAMRKTFAARRTVGDETMRVLMVFPLIDRVEVIVEDEP